MLISIRRLKSQLFAILKLQFIGKSDCSELSVKDTSHGELVNAPLRTWI